MQARYCTGLFLDPPPTHTAVCFYVLQGNHAKDIQLTPGYKA